MKDTIYQMAAAALRIDAARIVSVSASENGVSVLVKDGRGGFEPALTWAPGNVHTGYDGHTIRLFESSAAGLRVTCYEVVEVVDV